MGLVICQLVCVVSCYSVNKPSPAEKQDICSAIIATFPVLRDSSVTGYVSLSLYFVFTYEYNRKGRVFIWCFSIAFSLKPLRHESHSFTCKLHHARLSIHQMAPPMNEWRTSNCSLLLIYQPREDERLSWLGWPIANRLCMCCITNKALCCGLLSDLLISNLYIFFHDD